MISKAGSKDHRNFIEKERGKARMQFIGVISLTFFLYCSNLTRFTFHQFSVATVLFVLILWSIMRAACVSPGIVDDERMLKMVEEYNLSSPGGGRKTTSDLPKAVPDRVEQCPHTGKPRPARSHFATLLNANVLKLDHFCYFVNNVIGHRNYKYFWLVLIYLNAGSVYAVLVLIMLDVEINPYPSLVLSGMQLTVAVGGFAFTGMLMYRHSWLLRRNMTSVEYVKNNEYWCRAAHLNVKVPKTHAYDQTLLQNLKEAFGRDPLWLLPTTPKLPSDGYCWAVSPSRVKEVQLGIDKIQESLDSMFKNAGFKFGA